MRLSREAVSVALSCLKYLSEANGDQKPSAVEFKRGLQFVFGRKHNSAYVCRDFGIQDEGEPTV